MTAMPPSVPSTMVPSAMTAPVAKIEPKPDRRIYINGPPCVDELIKQADLLLYGAKQKGKNMICHEVIQS